MSYRLVLSLLTLTAACVDPNRDVPPDGSGEPPRGGDTDVTTDTDVDPSGDPGDDGAAIITVGAADRILLIGHVLAPDSDFDGSVLVEADRITCVEPGDACALQPGALGATIIDTHGVIAPGLIDTHNHILFDVFDDTDWLPHQLYTNHNQWTEEPRYSAMLDVKQCLENASQGKPDYCALTTYGSSDGNVKCEMDKWGELKGLIAGTTSIVGLPGTSSACFGSLARSIDTSQNGLSQDKIQTSAIFPPSTSSADGVCANFADGDTEAYLIHVGEGVDASALGEFTKLSIAGTDDGCLLAPQTAITHATAFTEAEFGIMAARGMKLTWSPASNLALYGQTTDIPSALAAHVTVALGPDWSMGGSQNMLDELRAADGYDNLIWGNQIAPKELVAMATSHGAQALGLESMLGSIAVGYYADIVVVGGQAAAPYDAILAATPADVRLVMVGGTVLYGDVALEDAAPAAPGCDTLDICGTPKFLCVATTDTTDKLDQTFADIKDTLEQAMSDVDDVSGVGWTFSPLAPVVQCGSRARVGRASSRWRSP